MNIAREVLDKRGAYWENRINVFLGESVKDNPVVFIGDSLTERFQLEKYFGKGFVNRGIGGDHADGLYERRDLLCLDKDPKALFFMVGINDLLFNYKRDEIPFHLSKILAYAKDKAPQAKLFVQSICPVKNWDTTSPAEIQKINAEIKELAESVGATYIDIFSLFADDLGNMKEEFTIDGVHLSESAYDLWASEIKKYL